MIHVPKAPDGSGVSFFGFFTLAIVAGLSLAHADEGISQVATYQEHLKVDNIATTNENSALPLRSANFKYTGSSDYKKHQARKVKYKGPGLEFNQITGLNQISPRKTKRSKNRNKLELQQLRTGGKYPSVFTRQLKAGKYAARRVAIPSLEEGPKRYCHRPPGKYTFEQLFLPSVPGIPPIAIIQHALETPSEPNDPTRLFIKPAKEEQPEHDVIVETEPKTDVTVEVIQH